MTPNNLYEWLWRGFSSAVWSSCRAAGPYSVGNRLRVSFCLLCSLPIAGCERASSPSAVPSQAAVPSAATVPAAAGVRLALLEPSANMSMARLEGVLAREGSCLYVVRPQKGLGRSMPAFQIAAVEWDDQENALRVEGATFRMGQRVVLGGGFPPNPGALPWRQRPDPACDASNLFMAGSIEAAR